MRINRFFIEEKIPEKELEIGDREILNQIKNVLKLKLGEKVAFFNNTEKEDAIAEIYSIEKNKIKLKIVNRETNTKEPKRKLCLFASILKRENFELLAQKATEIGVKKITPIITERTVKQNINYDRVLKIIKEAAEQSGRGELPKLEKPVAFNVVLEKIDKKEKNLIFDKLGKEFKPNKDSFKNVNIFIGPEGGWSEKEIQLAKNNGFEIISIGKLNLRAETASIVSSFLLLNY